ncbi:hypothetical protein BT93_F3161 [Corymbia citriodora subsp. variegata]|nr:hypothetical protein BT93_F3161 [Corymbia citriodora subsp. variegata]
MTRPSRESIDTFMAITGAPEPLAVRRLEEYDGNLNEAVNAHFTEGIHQMFPPPASTYPHEMYNQNRGAGRQGVSPLLDAVMSFKPSSLLDANYRRNFLNQIGASAFASPPPLASPPSNATGSPDASRSGYGYGPPYHTGSINTGTVIGTPVYSSTPAEVRSSPADGHDAEEEMLRAAIEASKQEVLSFCSGLSRRQASQEDRELDRAISLSLMEAEQEKEKRVQQVKDRDQESGFNASHGSADKAKDKRSKLGSASQPDEIKLEGLNLQDDKSNQHYHDHIRCGPDASQSDQKRLIQSGGSLPQEPAPDAREAINFIVRMPDGARHGRRFLMSDKLQSLFDFIDAGGWAKPMTYRLIRPYPREEFSDGDRFSSFSELGLTSKQEALFLEFI